MKQFFTLSLLSLLYQSLPAQDLTTTNEWKGKKTESRAEYQKQNAGRSAGGQNKPDKLISFNGQWKGGFSDSSSGLAGLNSDKIDYTLELDCTGSVVTGYSYTYFMGGSKRYYTICKLKGFINRATKEITVTEFERTKYNTPPDFRNCFQTHRLRYVKEGDEAETLEGSWMPAPDQPGGCGFGKTMLTRRLLKTVPLVTTPESFAATNKKSIPPGHLNKASRPLSLALKQKSTVLPQNKKRGTLINPSIKSNLDKNNAKNDVAKNDKDNNRALAVIPQIKKDDQVITPPTSFEQRSKAVLKTIEIQEDTFSVQLYDNGEVDGDSVSVFYNGNLLVSHKGLSEKPIRLSLKFNKSLNTNELTLYAENLGTIPPNTALMIVTDGDNRYEVRITSDTEKNGTIAFVHKK